MSAIDILLTKHCPDGVKFFALSEVCSTFSGGFIKKTKQDVNFKYPVYNGGAEPTGMYSDFNSEANSVAISARGSIGFVNWVEQRFWAGNSCHVVLSKIKNLDNRYVYFYLKHHELDLYALRNVGSIPALNLGPLLKFGIPVPHIDVQLEIIRILEEFTALEKELEKELVARRKQLEFYRNKLLSFKVLE